MEGSREAAVEHILRRMKAAGLDTTAVEGLFSMHEGTERSQLDDFVECGRRALRVAGRDPAKPYNRSLLEDLRSLFLPRGPAFETARGTIAPKDWRDNVEEDWRRLVDALGGNERPTPELAQLRGLLDDLIAKAEGLAGEDHEDRDGTRRVLVLRPFPKAVRKDDAVSHGGSIQFNESPSFSFATDLYTIDEGTMVFA